MNKKSLAVTLFIFVFLHILSYDSFAQSKNVIKTSVVPLFFKNYSLYFERGVSKNISFSVGGTIMPTKGINSMFSDLMTNFVKDPSGSVSNVALSGFSVTPEFRIYPGLKLERPAPHGFYIAFYAKFSSYNLDFPFTFTDISGAKTTYDFSGKYAGVGIGLMVGHQWIIANHISIDWWIAGAHYGNLNSTLDVTSDKLFTVNQTKFIQDLNNISFPQGQLNAQITGNQATITVDSPFIGFRTGITLGIAF